MITYRPRLDPREFHAYFAWSRREINGALEQAREGKSAESFSRSTICCGRRLNSPLAGTVASGAPGARGVPGASVPGAVAPGFNLNHANACRTSKYHSRLKRRGRNEGNGNRDDDRVPRNRATGPNNNHGSRDTVNVSRDQRDREQSFHDFAKRWKKDTVGWSVTRAVRTGGRQIHGCRLPSARSLPRESIDRLDTLVAPAVCERERNSGTEEIADR